jgi:hypothetical protein
VGVGGGQNRRQNGGYEQTTAIEPDGDAGGAALESEQDGRDAAGG